MTRLDVFLVENNKFENRSQVSRAVKENRITINGKVAKKAGIEVCDKDDIKIAPLKYNFVSRGGQKLQGAINTFGLNLQGVEALDIGSSTGGFCDCLLQNGASSVIAVDVGSNQLHTSLRKNAQITLFENTDFRQFELPKASKPTFACGDLSFISLTKIIPHLSTFNSITSVVLLIKPQFECGREIAEKNNGVIKDFKQHTKAINDVINCLHNYGYIVLGLAPSCIVGGSGNIEYVIYSAKCGSEINVKDIIADVIKQAKIMAKGNKNV